MHTHVNKPSRQPRPVPTSSVGRRASSRLAELSMPGNGKVYVVLPDGEAAGALGRIKSLVIRGTWGNVTLPRSALRNTPILQFESALATASLPPANLPFAFEGDTLRVDATGHGTLRTVGEVEVPLSCTTIGKTGEKSTFGLCLSLPKSLSAAYHGLDSRFMTVSVNRAGGCATVDFFPRDGSMARRRKSSIRGNSVSRVILGTNREFGVDLLFRCPQTKARVVVFPGSMLVYFRDAIDQAREQLSASSTDLFSPSQAASEAGSVFAPAVPDFPAVEHAAGLINAAIQGGAVRLRINEDGTIIPVPFRQQA